MSFGVTSFWRSPGVRLDALAALPPALPSIGAWRGRCPDDVDWAVGDGGAVVLSREKAGDRGEISGGGAPKEETPY